MPKPRRDKQTSIWHRLFVERSNTKTLGSDPRPVFLVFAVAALMAGILGWTVASIAKSWLVPILSATAIFGGLLGVRSRVRTIALLGFVMGMLLLPTAVNTIIVLLRT